MPPTPTISFGYATSLIRFWASGHSTRAPRPKPPHEYRPNSAIAGRRRVAPGLGVTTAVGAAPAFFARSDAAWTEVVANSAAASARQSAFVISPTLLLSRREGSRRDDQWATYASTARLAIILLRHATRNGTTRHSLRAASAQALR